MSQRSLCQGFEGDIRSRRDYRPSQATWAQAQPPLPHPFVKQNWHLSGLFCRRQPHPYYHLRTRLRGMDRQDAITML